MQTFFKVIFLFSALTLSNGAFSFEPPNSMGNSGVPEGC